MFYAKHCNFFHIILGAGVIKEGGRYSSFQELMLCLTEQQCLSTYSEETPVLSRKNQMKWKTQFYLIKLYGPLEEAHTHMYDFCKPLPN